MRKKQLPKRLYINSVKFVGHLQNVQYKFKNHCLYNKTILSLCYHILLKNAMNNKP